MGSASRHTLHFPSPPPSPAPPTPICDIILVDFLDPSLAWLGNASGGIQKDFEIKVAD
jgi:hypothetical protein